MVDTRWCVTYTTFVNSRKKAKHKGSMVLRSDVSRIVLYDQDDHVVDVRPLHAGELIYHGSVIHLPSHIVDVGERITPSRGINRQTIEKDSYHKEIPLLKDNRDNEKRLGEDNKYKKKRLGEDNRDNEKRLGEDNRDNEKRLGEDNKYKKKRLGDDNRDRDDVDEAVNIASTEVFAYMKNEQIPAHDQEEDEYIFSDDEDYIPAHEEDDEEDEYIPADEEDDYISDDDDDYIPVDYDDDFIHVDINDEKKKITVRGEESFDRQCIFGNEVEMNYQQTMQLKSYFEELAKKPEKEYFDGYQRPFVKRYVCRLTKSMVKSDGEMEFSQVYTKSQLLKFIMTQNALRRGVPVKAEVLGVVVNCTEGCLGSAVDKYCFMYLDASGMAKMTEGWPRVVKGFSLKEGDIWMFTFDDERGLLPMKKRDKFGAWLRITMMKLQME
ncbi:hypothetical protein QYE76_044619 [Lolium multiflorum]|uniref:Uncharacterized protein n=1 Tax=Lolium multiflorum TaxID=4521 RepID=A0AAD8TLF0_LOLMU|nr:hypothetical protein QYE76_044619 [Lolium multiflorum]